MQNDKSEEECLKTKKSTAFCAIMDVRVSRDDLAISCPFAESVLDERIAQKQKRV